MNNRLSQRQTSSSPRQKECVMLGVGVTVTSDPIIICTKRMRDARGRGHIMCDPIKDAALKVMAGGLIRYQPITPSP